MFMLYNIVYIPTMYMTYQIPYSNGSGTYIHEITAICNEKSNCSRKYMYECIMYFLAVINFHVWYVPLYSVESDMPIYIHGRHKIKAHWNEIESQ